MSTDVKPFLEGKWSEGEAGAVPILDKYRSRPIGDLHQASRAQVQQATAAVAASQQRDRLAPARRAEILKRAAELIRESEESFTHTMAVEGGFALNDARREAQRAAATMMLCAEEATRISGDLVPLGAYVDDGSRIAFTTLHPVGVVCAITPFNAPLNTVVHKVGPAIAAGNGVVLKPSSYTPRTAALLVQLLLEAGLPEGLISLLYGDGPTVGQWLLEDPIPSFYAFTGSSSVGLQITRTIGIRRSQLELGSLASTIVCEDADVSQCVAECVDAGFRKAGQICTSIQRLHVQRPIIEDFVGQLRARLDGRTAGDPEDPGTFIGPLISAAETDRVESWIAEATDEGAEVVSGAHRVGSTIEPTVLLDVDKSAKLMTNEVFGPVICVEPFDRIEAAIDAANDTPYGLAAGVYTNRMDVAFEAINKLQMGSVHINATSNGRLDVMPYTGVKLSGWGKEGPRYATAEMSEERLVTFKRQ